MGMPVVGPALEHQMGVIELYEYLKSSPFIGPFGTLRGETKGSTIQGK